MQTPPYDLKRTYTRDGRPGFYSTCRLCHHDVTPWHDTAFTTSGMVSSAMGDHANDCDRGFAVWAELFAEFQEVDA